MALRPLPQTFATTREALHEVAERIVAPARKPDNEIALEATPGGFGTPEFEYDDQRQRVRVDGAELVREIGDDVRRAPLTSLLEAAAVVEDLLSDPSELPAEPLEIDAESGLALGDWYELGNSVLAELVSAAGAGDDPSSINLWPEHFDIAIELGSEADGTRANYGFSPGDEDHPDPYLYVGPWTAEVSGELWHATGFRGAELGYAELLASADPHRAAIDFCQGRKLALEKEA